DDIKIQYHPASKLASKIYHFQEFNRGGDTETDVPLSETPWDPFPSRIDFDFAKFTLSAALSRDEIDALINMCHRIASGEEHLSFNSHVDVQNTWALASSTVTPFTKHVITVPYKGEQRSYDLYTRDIWEYCKDILRNP
ncbi:hypothetical protein C8Q73DRAFT_619686, partial [Cubamyces lactineus]